MQDAAAQALRDGLVNFDGGRGWRDLEMSVDVDGDWAGQLDRAPVGVGFPNWRKAVVLSKSGGEARDRLHQRHQGDSSRLAGIDGQARRRRPRVRLPAPRHGHHRQGARRRRLRLALDPRGIAAGCSPRRSIPAACWRCRAASTSSARATTARPRRFASRAPPFKPIVYVTALENGMTPATILVDSPFCVWQGAGLGNKCFVNFDRRYSGAKTMRWGVEQSRNLMTVRAAAETGMSKVIANAKKLGVGEYPNYLSIALGAGDTTVAKLVNAYAVLANQGRAVRQSTDRFRPGPQRQGHLSHRQPLRADEQLQCARLERQGDAAAAQPHPPADRPDGRVPDGPHPRGRGRARHRDDPARPRPAACSARPGRPAARPTCGSSAARPISSPGSISASTSRAHWAAMPRAAGSRRRSSSNGPRSRSPTSPRCRSSRRPGSAGFASIAAPARRCSAPSRLTEDPKSSVIWEAFQPQTEPRRAYRHSQGRDEEAGAASARRRSRARARPRPQAAPARRRAATPAPLPSQNTVQ